MKRLAAFMSLFAALLAAATPARPQDALARIAGTGRIVIGHRLSETPFSYVAEGKVTGYATEICEEVIEAMRPALGLQRLQVEFVPVTTVTRFIMIASGRIDLECAATTNTAARRRLAEFSYPHFMTATRFVSRRKEGLSKLADLRGRSVASTTGTVNIEQLNTLNRRENFNISVMLTRSHEEAFHLVETGRASAFVMADILLAGLVANAPDPAAFSISQEALSKPEPYGILMPPGDLAFKALFNREMLRLFENGGMARLYDRWFNSPVPPNGTNLRLPLSEEMKAVFAAPRLHE